MVKKMAGLVALVFLAGCAPRVPYTPKEKVLLATAIAGQAADYITTDRAMSHGCVEQNLIYGGHREAIAVGKVAISGIIWVAAQNMGHESRAWFLPVAGLVGFGAAGYNLAVDCK